MPATVFVRFDAPGPVEATPRRLHAAWGRVLALPEGVSPERAARLPALAHRPPHDQPSPKPYCLGDMTQTPDGLGVELRFLDDRLLDTLDAWLAWGGILPIGDGGQATTMLAAIEAQVLEQADWEDLAVFTSRGHHVPEVTAASLATSLHARWRHWCRPLAPELPERERLTSVLITQDRTRRTVVGLGMPRADRRGRLSSRRIPASVGALRISAPAAGSITAVFSQLMALARYTSVGSHGAYGMGVIDVVADAP